MTTIFVATEFAPLTPGGAGAVVAGLAALLRDGGVATDTLLVLDHDAPAVDDHEAVTVVRVRPGLDGEVADPRGRFLARSRAAARAVVEQAAGQPETTFEFFDFDGLGFWSLTHRQELGLTTTPLTVRFHGPVDLMWEATGHGHEEWETVREMERASFQLADRVLVPSTGIGALVRGRYGVEPDRVVVAPPPVSDLPALDRDPAPDPVLAVVGRLGEVKGSGDMVTAALRLLDLHPALTVRFVGADGWSAEAGRPMREVLEGRIPADRADRIQFLGPVPRDRLARLLEDVWAVVVPSRFESFCLAAHEARRAGLPVVVPDLPAFAGLFSEATGAVVYDGSVDGLVASLERLIADGGLRARLAAAPAPRVEDPLGAYEAPAPQPRHARVQAGLATAAVKRVEATIPEPAPPRTATLARRMLRHLPEPVARLAVRVMPQRIKDRFRQVADWRVEAERRETERDRSELLARVARGEYPEVPSPDVTVVIPCYDQGAFVEDAILSVFRQTHDSWEIVVVDDGSTDPKTIATLDALDLPRVRLHRQDNRGLPGARNSGMRLARGRYLVPLDADDELAPAFLERLLADLEQRPDAAYAHCWAELFGDQSALWVNRPFNAYQLLLSNSVVGCVLLRRSAWEAVGGYAEDMLEGNEDWDLWLRLLEAGWDQVEVREPLFRYRKHGVSMSVETEARFERARARMPQRHPGLYDLERLRARKAATYPWVSVLVPTDADVGALAAQTLDDVELLPVGGPVAGLGDLAEEHGWTLRDGEPDVHAAVAASHGKVVVDWAGVRAASPEALARLADVLESPGEAAGAVPSDWTAPQPFAWRRWTLVDRDGPSGPAIPVDVDLHVAASGRLQHGMAPQAGWDIRDDVPADNSLPLLRQPPEEEGPLPTWITDQVGA